MLFQLVNKHKTMAFITGALVLPLYAALEQENCVYLVKVHY